MKTMIYIIAICLLGLMAVPVITPVESKGNSVFADVVAGDCPDCWTWIINDAICTLICQPYTEHGGYYLWAQAEKLENGNIVKQDEWAYCLMILSGLNRCCCYCEPNPELCCHEYTACMTVPDGWLYFNGNWRITDGSDFDEYIICEGRWLTGKPDWLLTWE
ncbi:hypothetical protein KKB18_01115 [bacterium]|nr:hypothetical protein [bacterium]